MIRSISLLVLVSLFIACSDRSSLPAGVLPGEKMEAVLWDMLRADLFVANYIAIRDSSQAGHAKGPQLYAATLKKHGISDSVFKTSLNYYRKHPKQFYPILDSIAQRPVPAPTNVVSTAPKPADTVPATKPALKSTPDRPELTPLAY
ncbi:MAG: DUF4296 domain-containing protein [Bacteroidota bacterium]